MAMRDPGTPGRNPFFDHGPDAELGDLGPERDDLGEEAFERELAAGGFGGAGFGGASAGADDFAGPGFEGDGFERGRFGSEEPRPDFSAGPGAWAGAAGVDPIGTLAALVDALAGAQPEATEHLVAAAHELVLAVKTVVDATEAVLAAQRSATAPAPQSDDEPAHDPFSSADEERAPSRPSGVRRIDLA